MQQRELYKVVERLTKKKFISEIDLLKSTLREIIDHADIVITGGRLWEFSAEDAYLLRYQYGLIEHIPNDYSIDIADEPAFSQITKKRIVTKHETDALLRKKGIELFCVTGAGDLLTRNNEQYYKYVLAFNAPELNENFLDTVNIIASAVMVRLSEIKRQGEHKKLQKALDQAWEIQRGLLPDHEANFHDYSIFGISLPDATVGGDYFDYLRPTAEHEERLGIVISDAASKGLPAAIQALFVSGAIRMGIGFHTKISSLIARLNTLIYETFPYERFVTLFYCELTRSSNGLVLYANAGHCPPLHYRAQKEDFKLLNSTGGILGIVPEQQFRVENINMRSGDILVLYTDGILEAQNKAKKIFGESKIMEIVKNNNQLSAKEIAYMIIESVQQFASVSTYSDDKTLVIIKRA